MEEAGKCVFARTASTVRTSPRDGAPPMYCSECGVKGTGKFCTACGNRLVASQANGSGEAGCDLRATVALPVDWSNVVDYEQLISIPAVRDRIARAAAQSKKRMTGEEILDLYGKAMGNSPAYRCRCRRSPGSPSRPTPRWE